MEMEKIATAKGDSLRISFKDSVEICNAVRKKPLPTAIGFLEQVVSENAAIPFRRFNSGGTGHRKGIGTGRYPKKACIEIIKLLRSAEANAQNKGLDPSRLVVAEIKANKGSRGMHFGRHRGRFMKRTHVDIVLSEKSGNKDREKGEGKGKKSDNNKKKLLEKELLEKKTEEAQKEKVKKIPAEAKK